jgi:type IV pilus assembly protein PilV
MNAGPFQRRERDERRRHPLRHRRHGGTLLEGMLTVVMFSVGLLAILRLLAASIVESGNVQCRSEASLLANDLISQMWTGDRSFKGINDRFGKTSADDYQRWLAVVKERLPGISETNNTPKVTIDSDRTVTVSLYWKSSGDKDTHQLTVQSRITD